VRVQPPRVRTEARETVLQTSFCIRSTTESSAFTFDSLGEMGPTVDHRGDFLEIVDQGPWFREMVHHPDTPHTVKVRQASPVELFKIADVESDVVDLCCLTSPTHVSKIGEATLQGTQPIGIVAEVDCISAIVWTEF
jgi:hypothetical protein